MQCKHITELGREAVRPGAWSTGPCISVGVSVDSVDRVDVHVVAPAARNAANLKQEAFLCCNGVKQAGQAQPPNLKVQVVDRSVLTVKDSKP